jgi:two-component system, NtrC family, response regulator
MTDKPTLLVVEDDEGLRSQYRWAFPSCEVVLAGARASAVAAVEKAHPPVIIMDLGLPPDPDGVSEGFATLEDVLRIAPESKIIVVTGNGERETALKAVSLGAYDYCEKPVEPAVLRHHHRARLPSASAGGRESSPRIEPGTVGDRADRHRGSGDAEGLSRR